MTDAPWYVRNDTLHTDIHLPLVSDILQKTYFTLFDTFQLHTNQLISNNPNRLPLPQRERKHHTDLRIDHFIVGLLLDSNLP
jgi:hypothetical protein